MVPIILLQLQTCDQVLVLKHIHFIDQQWNLKNRCLQIQFLPEDHSAEIMEATLEAWNLTATKQVCLTTDNSSNILKATRDLGLIQLSCFGYILDLANHQGT